MIRRLIDAAVCALFGAYVLAFAYALWISSHQPPRDKISSARHHQIEANETGSPYRWEWGHSDPAVAFFTFGLCFIAAVQAGLFVVQLRYMNQGLADAKEAADAAKDAAIAARANAETAKEQVAITKMGVIDLERAYLAVGPTEIVVDFIRSDIAKARGHFVVSDPKEVTVHLLVQNTGRTGATIKKIYGILTEQAPIGDVPLYPPLADQPVITDLAIPAGTGTKLDPFEFKSDYVGNQFFWGYIEYRDIFKNKRTSRFCAHLEVAARGDSRGKFQIAGSEGWRECD
jgi:hypothetical protein